MTAIIQGLFALDLFAKNGVPTIYAHNHRLSGTVKINTAAAENKRVAVFAQGSSDLVDVTTTDATGAWSIKGIPSDFDGVPLTVIITDETDTYNALIADNVKTVGINEAR